MRLVKSLNKIKSSCYENLLFSHKKFKQKSFNSFKQLYKNYTKVKNIKKIKYFMVYVLKLINLIVRGRRRPFNF